MHGIKWITGWILLQSDNLVRGRKKLDHRDLVVTWICSVSERLKPIVACCAVPVDGGSDHNLVGQSLRI